MRQAFCTFQQPPIQKMQELDKVVFLCWSGVCLPVWWECAQQMHCAWCCRSASEPFSLGPLGFAVQTLNCILLCCSRNVGAWHWMGPKPWSVASQFESVPLLCCSEHEMRSGLCLLRCWECLGRYKEGCELVVFIKKCVFMMDSFVIFWLAWFLLFWVSIFLGLPKESVNISHWVLILVIVQQ